MALTKKEKIKLLENYVQLLKSSENAIVLSYEAIPVSVSVSMRKEFKKFGSLYKVVKKRVFAMAVEKVGYNVDLSKMSNSVAILFTKDDGIASLKVIEKYKKEWKKEKSLCKLIYLGWWFAWEWRDADYVKILSKIPSKEELVSKFMYMLKYPIQGFVSVNSNLISWFVRVLDQIREKK